MNFGYYITIFIRLVQSCSNVFQCDAFLQSCCCFCGALRQHDTLRFLSAILHGLLIDLSSCSIFYEN